MASKGDPGLGDGIDLYEGTGARTLIYTHHADSSSSVNPVRIGETLEINDATRDR